MKTKNHTVLRATNLPKPALQNPVVNAPLRVETQREVKAGRYTLSQRGDGRYWLQRQSGEGMAANRDAIERMLGEFFNREF